MSRTRHLLRTARTADADIPLPVSMDLPENVSGLVLAVDARGEAPPSRPSWMAAMRAQGLGVMSTDLAGQRGESEPPTSLIAARLRCALLWLRAETGHARLPLGVMSNASTTAATLVAAAEQPTDISAVVAHGGRPDLAGLALRYVSAATLFIVGSEDDRGLAACQLAFDELPGTKSLEIVLGAGRNFEKPEAKQLFAQSAAGWLAEHLCTTEVR